MGMKTHIIQNMIIQDDRRGMEPKWAIPERRSTPHKYSSPKFLIWIPVEEHFAGILNSEKDSPNFSIDKFIKLYPPFSPNDLLVEPSMTDAQDFYEDEMTTYKQYKVEQVVGVEELASNVSHKAGEICTGDVKWHWLIIGEKEKAIL
jgi:hypothetical protein